MTYLLVFVTVFSHLVLPFFFLWWVAFNKSNSIAYRVSVATFVTSFFVLMWEGGAGWHWFGSAWPSLYLLLLVPALLRMIFTSKNCSWIPEKKFSTWFHFIMLSSLAVIFSVSLPQLFAPHHFSVEPIDLEFPLKNGTYHIVHGGSSESVNHHFPVNAQKFALDIVKLNQWGIRAWGLMPKDLDKYEIFEENLYSPCSGEVISTKNNLPDNTPPETHKESLLGNYVVIFCDGHSILLAHMKKGSITVSLGEKVNSGELIGKVGNSGNTTEPHLHIHAVKGKTTDKKEIVGSAQGIPITFKSRFLTRNDRVQAL